MMLTGDDRYSAVTRTISRLEPTKPWYFRETAALHANNSHFRAHTLLRQRASPHVPRARPENFRSRRARHLLRRRQHSWQDLHAGAWIPKRAEARLRRQAD